MIPSWVPLRGRAIWFGIGFASALAAVTAYHQIGTAYWQNPGWFVAEIPRLHAWALRLMEIGRAAQNGSADYQVLEDDWETLGFSLKACFESGAEEMIIRYDSASDSLYGFYRCQMGEVIGELQVGYPGPTTPGFRQGGTYVFRTMMADTAVPLVHTENLLPFPF